MSYDRDKYIAGRFQANEESRKAAKRHREPWSEAEDDFLRQEWLSVGEGDRDEATIAEILERTIEACRNRAHFLRHGKQRYVEIVETTTTTKRYIGLYDDDEDRWWETR